MNTGTKVLVIGCPGAGKSTFARKLRDRTGLPLRYLDMLFHKPDRTTVDRETFDTGLRKILEGAEWIIDGNYQRTLALRFEACTDVFLFDLPVEQCLQNAAARVGSVREDLPWVETEFDADFRQYILDFPKDQLPVIYELIDRYHTTRQITIFHSSQEADDWLSRFRMDEKELYQTLGSLTKHEEQWKEHIAWVSSLLTHASVRIRAKALWLLGEMGLRYPTEVQGTVPEIAVFLNSSTPLLRARAVNALGRIGRGSFPVIEPYWKRLFRFASDEDAGVRLSFVWASENIATNAPDLYADEMPIFAALLRDADDKVRMEAPEMFRVIGKRRPTLVMPYAALLQRISETDPNRVVRIHCLGAIKAAGLGSANRDSEGGDIC